MPVRRAVISCCREEKRQFYKRKVLNPLEKLRNIAIIAHVDHGKTTLVDEMLKQSGVYRENQEVVERVMDSGDLERERGITIMAKNTAVTYKDTKINIVDTPGHADFGGEVERVLKMVNGVLLLVDAAEGPMPQTRFVLSRALELGHRVIVVVNKIDRPDQRVYEVVDEVLELLMDLDATDEQLDSPMLFCSGRQGTASVSPDVPGTDLQPLFDTILEYIPEPEQDITKPFQMLVSSVDYNEYVGRIAIGRIERGEIRQNQEIEVCNYHDPEAAPKKAKAVSLYEFDGLARVPVTEAAAGSIIAMSGIGDVTIGDTICAKGAAEALPFVKISAPTLEMTFSVNDSPFAGREGKFVTSRQISERLRRETLKDVSLRVSDIESSTDSFNVAGRGEMSLSILIETMRREGYEFQVSPPRVLYKEIDGKRCEPIERVVVDVPQEYIGSVIEKLGQRKGELLGMNPVGSRMKAEFLVPSRGLFGYRNEFLTDTKGEGIMASVFEKYGPHKGDIARRSTGSLIAWETGESVTYGLFSAQERGALFIGPGVPVYGGMVIGECPKQEDITLNVCKKKQLTNTRAAGSDEALRLIPPRQLSLEQCLEFLADDELLEVTPKSLRLRKRILDHDRRMKSIYGKK
ncbi:MAG: translational GTPase TypA [Oscillospiraceae bacterium]|nr:translational GTPase TypA [Oscillospiraceae bacterium]